MSSQDSGSAAGRETAPEGKDSDGPGPGDAVVEGKEGWEGGGGDPGEWTATEARYDTLEGEMKKDAFDIKTTRCGPKGRTALRFAFVFFALLPSSSACPNKCMGRGICNLHDQCECMLGYQGADCSELSCPMGKAWTGYVDDDGESPERRERRERSEGE